MLRIRSYASGKDVGSDVGFYISLYKNDEGLGRLCDNAAVVEEKLQIASEHTYVSPKRWHRAVFRQVAWSKNVTDQKGIRFGV